MMRDPPHRTFAWSRIDGRRMGNLHDRKGWNTPHGFVTYAFWLYALAGIVKDVDVADPYGAEQALQYVRAMLMTEDPTWTLHSPQSWAT